MNKIKKVLKSIPFVENAYIKMNRKRVIKRMAEHGHELLNAANNALKETGLTYFLDFGTLLGFIREGDFIGHDPDIDIAVLYTEDAQGVIEKALLEKGFTKYLTYKKNGKIVEEAYSYKGIKMDIFYYFESDDKETIYTFDAYSEKNVNYKEPFNKTMTKKTYTPLEGTKEFKNDNIEFMIPMNEVDWIVEKYGDNWKTPVKEWSLDSGFTKDNHLEKTRDGQQIVHK